MVEGQGGLNIKDYPFAFSIATLLFPQILTDPTPPTTSIIFGIILIGGMLGSILTIINPINLLIRELYWKTTILKVYPKMNSQNVLVKQILKLNFAAALSNPQISYESNKIVGMLYFLFILGFAIIRTFTGMSLNETELLGIRIGAIIGFIGVMLILLNHTFGLMLKKSYPFMANRGIKQLDRIRSVTISNLAVDFANLSNEGQRWINQMSNNNNVASFVSTKLAELEALKIDSSDEFQKNVSRISFDLEQLFKNNNLNWNLPLIMTKLYSAYRSAQEISLRYDTKLSETLTWFYYPLYLQTTEFDEPISQLQSSIEGRDWYNAALKTYRITDRLESFLQEKNMHKKLTKST